MTKDKELEALFASAITEFNDNDIFIDKLSSRLDKVEFLKRIQQEQKRSCRRYLVVAFVAGVLSSLMILGLTYGLVFSVYSVLAETRKL